MENMENTTMMNQENNSSMDTVPAADTNGLVGLAVKGAIGVVSLFTAYKLGKKAKAEEKAAKPKKRLHFQAPITFVEKEQQEEEEKTEEEVKEETKEKETKKK